MYHASSFKEIQLLSLKRRSQRAHAVLHGLSFGGAHPSSLGHCLGQTFMAYVNTYHM